MIGRVYLDPGDKWIRHDPPRRVVCLGKWGPGGGPHNVLARELPDGPPEVIPFTRRLLRSDRMRASDARTALTAQVETHFESDVAAALIADSVMYEQCARKLGRSVETAEQIEDAVKAIAEQVDDDLSDRLTEEAESPAGWLYARFTEHLDRTGS